MKLWGIKDKQNGLWASVWVSKCSAQMATAGHKDLKLKVVRVTLNEVRTKKAKKA